MTAKNDFFLSRYHTWGYIKYRRWNDRFLGSEDIVAVVDLPPQGRRCAGKTGQPDMWTTDFESQHYCEKCGKILDHMFSDYGAREEIENSYGEDGPITPEEAFTLVNVIDCGVPLLTEWGNKDGLRDMLVEIADRLDLPFNHKNGV